MFFNKFASCSIPYLSIFFIVDILALALNSFGLLFTYANYLRKINKPMSKILLLFL